MWRNSFAVISRAGLWWVLIAIVMLSAALRLWRLDLLPPGLFFDEAYNGFDARQVLQGDYLPLYFPANNGREPLFIYLQALSVALLGATPYALRVVSALTGILTIPIIYFCAHTILKNGPAISVDSRRAGWLALVAATGVAISYWHLSLSRLGFRVNLLIPVSALAIAFFWRAWTKQRLRDYGLAGFWLALALYTYIAARFLPLVILAFVAVELAAGLWTSRGQRGNFWRVWRPRVYGLLLLVAVALVTVAPLAWTLLNDPALLSARTDQVSIWAAVPAGRPAELLDALASNAITVVRAFYDQGDFNLRHNLPGRPANDPLLALLFTIGWLAALWQIRQARFRLLLIWFGVMLLPTVLSTEAPHYLRGAGALPPLAIFYAVGAGTIADLLSKSAALRSRSFAEGAIRGLILAAILLLVLSLSGTLTAVDYFGRWAKLPRLGHVFDVDLQLAATQAAQQLESADSKEALLMSTQLYLQPQMGFALGQVLASGDLPPLEEGVAGVRMLKREGFDPKASLMLLWSDEGQPVSTWLEPLDPSDDQATTQSDTLISPDHQPGWPQLTEVRLAQGTSLRPRQIRYPLDVAFANGVRLVGYDVEPDVLEPGSADRELRLTLFWQAHSPHDTFQVQERGDFDAFVHLNAGGAVVQTNNGPFRRSDLAFQLHLGQPAVDDVRFLAPPPQTPVGKAYFEVGLYRYRPGIGQGAMGRIAIVDGEGQPVADRIDLGVVWLGAPPAAGDLSDLQALGVQFDHRIDLVGAKVLVDSGDPRRLLVDLGWEALDRSTTDYTAFVHLIDESGQIIAQYDAPPGGPGNPTHLLVPGETVRSIFPLDLPSEPAADGIRLRIGLYEPVSGRQLPITTAGNSMVDTSAGTYVLIPLKQLQQGTPTTPDK